MKRKWPAFQFYPGDWMKDPALRAASFAARGLWMDMLCMMHEAPHRGFLESASGVPYTAQQIARMTGGAVPEVEALLEEIFRDKICSKSHNGAIYCRRMKRDQTERDKNNERQRRFRNANNANENSNGVVTRDSVRDKGVTGAGDVTPLSHGSSSSSSSSLKKLKYNRESLTGFSRAVGGNGTVDNAGDSAHDSAHARSHPTAAEAETDTETLAFPGTEADTATGSESTLPETNPPTFTPRQSQLHAGVIKSLFAHYCEVCGHDPARYTLTPQRLKKALLRLHEQIKATGSLALAVENFKTAIQNLAASEYHRTHGFTDWEAQLFRSREEFEKRLNMKPSTPTEVSHAQPRFESIEEHNARVMREANARMDK